MTPAECLEPLTAEHTLDLRQRDRIARRLVTKPCVANQASGASRTFVVCDAGRGLLVHAISEDAKAFYLRLGLEPSPIEPMTLMATVADLKVAGIVNR